VSLGRNGKNQAVREDTRDREETEREEPAVLSEQEAISILAQSAKPDDRDEDSENGDSDSPQS
jgi:hypothetical protein